MNDINSVPTSFGEEDIKERTRKFIEDYGELVKKYKMDFASYPAFQPDGKGAFNVVIQSVPMDVSQRPEPSPFIAQ